MLPRQAMAETSTRTSSSTIEERKRFWRSEGEKTSSSSGSFLVARNRSSILLVLVLVSAIGCQSGDLGVPKSNKLALMGLQPRAEPSRSLRGEEAFQIPLNLAPLNRIAPSFGAINRPKDSLTYRHSAGGLPRSLPWEGMQPFRCAVSPAGCVAPPLKPQNGLRTRSRPLISNPS